MIYVTSDHHFGHENIIKYEDRPFHSMGEMNAAMIEYWNRSVTNDDIVIHLGDFSLMKPDMTVELVRQLNGKIILINGNHDRRTRSFWENRAGILKWYKRSQLVNNILWLTHAVDWHGVNIKSYGTTNGRVDDPPSRPFTIWTGKKTVPENGHIVSLNRDIVLHGHTHGKIKQAGYFINCGVDGWNFTPIPLPTILPPLIVKFVKEWIIDECL